MMDIKSVLVIGHGGARMDFVAGWLGKLDGFVDTGWIIDQFTGESLGGMRLTKCLDNKRKHSNIVTEFANQGFNLSDKAELSFASTLHGFYLNSQLDGCTTKNLKIINIIVTEKYFNNVIWDFIVKTVIPPSVHEGNILEVSTIKQNIYHYTNGLESRKNKFNFPTIDIDYEKILSIDGAHLIAEQLGVTPTPKQYQLWEDALRYASSPEEIVLHGRTWRKQDFF